MLQKLIALLLLCPLFSSGQNGYSDNAAQTTRLKNIAKNHPALAQLKSIATTNGGKDIWMLTLGSGNTDAHPAIAIVGGVEGNHILGTELAIGFAENLLQSAGTDSIKNLLAKTTFYIFPNMSPDAMAQYFAPLKYERTGNSTSTDDDRDGRNDEDGPDDLDNNGKISWIRIESPVGDYRTHPDDPRVLIKADLSKGEKGKYLLIPEGIDNDKDGTINEDQAGGVAFNKNLTYKHPSFTAGSGEFPASETETRALLDVLYDKFNVYALISFGPNNNLSTAYAFNAAATQGLISGWLEPDTKVNSMVSELYNKTLGMKDAPKSATIGGDLLSWGYYHYGRYSFSTPGWWVPKTKPDSARNEKAFTVEDAGANYLRWAGQQGITDNFTEWKPVSHPDYPGQKAEVGGIDPFVMTTPPYRLVADLVKKNSQFLVKLAGYQPEVDIVNIKTEKVSPLLTRITADVINKGALASHSKLGERNNFVKRISVKLIMAEKQSVISGKKIQVLNSLEGYGTQQLTWLIKGSGKLQLEAGSPTTGNKTIEINL